jgi:hypothetical protein
MDFDFINAKLFDHFLRATGKKFMILIEIRPKMRFSEKLFALLEIKKFSPQTT